VQRYGWLNNSAASFAEADMTQQFEDFLLRLSHVSQSPGFWSKAHSASLQFLLWLRSISLF